MSKMSQLSAEIDELRRCGETLVGIAETLKELFSGEGDAEATESQKPVRKTAASKSKAKAEPEAEKEAELSSEKKPLTLEDVRAVLAEKSRAGFTEEVKAVIANHGASKLSGIDPSEYEAVITEVEVLGNA